MANPLTSLLGGDLIREIGQTVRQVLPNEGAQRDFDLKMAEIADKADERDTSILQAQIGVNNTEAANSNLFVSGARPFIIWVCGFGIAMEFILRPVVVAFGVNAFPHMDSNLLLGILGPILGLGTMRTIEKINGVASGQVGKTKPEVLQEPVETQVQTKSDQKSRWFSNG